MASSESDKQKLVSVNLDGAKYHVPKYGSVPQSVEDDEPKYSTILTVALSIHLINFAQYVFLFLIGIMSLILEDGWKPTKLTPEITKEDDKTMMNHLYILAGTNTISSVISFLGCYFRRFKHFSRPVHAVLIFTGGILSLITHALFVGLSSYFLHTDKSPAAQQISKAGGAEFKIFTVWIRRLDWY